jgi:L-lactate permease
MAGSMASGFSNVGTAFIILSPILGWIAVALSGSNTASNAVFGLFRTTVGKLLGAPALIFPALNSVGAEVGKPVFPQTASVGVSTSRFVRNEGEVIRHNLPWTLVVLVYLIAIRLSVLLRAAGRHAALRPTRGRRDRVGPPAKRGEATLTPPALAR